MKRFQSRDGFRPGQSIELLSASRHEIVERSSRSGSRLAASDIQHVIDPRVHSVRAPDRESYPIRSLEWGGEKLVESRRLGSRLGWLGDNISVHATTCVGWCRITFRRIIVLCGVKRRMVEDGSRSFRWYCNIDTVRRLEGVTVAWDNVIRDGFFFCDFWYFLFWNYLAGFFRDDTWLINFSGISWKNATCLKISFIVSLDLS